MGQSETADNKDDNCFRACVKQKKEKSKKIQALPYYPEHKDFQFYGKSPEEIRPERDYCSPAESPKIRHSNQNTFETSLNCRLSCQQAKRKGKILPQNSVNFIPNILKIGCPQQKSFDIPSQLTLGLQSKFSSSKQIFSSTTAKIISQKRNSERNSAGTRCSSHEKECGSQSQITNKTNQTSITSESKKKLRNKVEEIKQKYYERELEIQIYHDEREYQQQIKNIKHHDRSNVRKGQVQEPSIGEIKAVRNKILAKLKERRNINIVDVQAKKQTSQYLNANQPLTVQDQLQLYSKQGNEIFKDALIDSQGLKQSKTANNNLTNPVIDKADNLLNRPDCSMEQKMQFSDQSFEANIHQIRQLDEQHEDHPSKITGHSALQNTNQGKKAQDKKPSSISRPETVNQHSACKPANLNFQQSSPHPNQQKDHQQSSSNHSILSHISSKNQPNPSSPPKLPFILQK